MLDDERVEEGLDDRAVCGRLAVDVQQPVDVVVLVLEDARLEAAERLGLEPPGAGGVGGVETWAAWEAWEAWGAWEAREAARG